MKKRLASAYNLDTVKPIVWGITHEVDALVKYQAEFGAAVTETGKMSKLSNLVEMCYICVCNLYLKVSLVNQSESFNMKYFREHK